MNTIESALVAATLALLAVSISCGRGPLVRLGAAATGVLLIADIFLTGRRLGMAGEYVTAAALCWAAAFPIRLPHTLCRMAQAAGTLLLLWTIAAGTFVPDLLVPLPGGPYLVGYTVPQLELGPELASSFLRPAVAVWYPADGLAVGSFPLPRAAASWIAHRFPPWGLTGAALAKSERKFPLLLYFSGWPGANIDGISLIRELASHGFAVASVYYPMEMPGLGSGAQAVRKANLERPIDFGSDDAFNATLKFMEERVRQRAGDATAVRHAFSWLNSNDPSGRFTGRLDLEHVGILGFSFGGSTAAEARVLDREFKAALNMDGSHYDGTLSANPGPPYLLMLSDETRIPTPEEISSTAAPEARYNAILDKRDFDGPIARMKREGGYILRIPGTNHINFSDGAFSGSPFRNTRGDGSISPFRAQAIIAAYSIAFFKKYLLDQPSPLLDGDAQEFPDARLEAWKTAISENPAR